MRIACVPHTTCQLPAQRPLFRNLASKTSLMTSQSFTADFHLLSDAPLLAHFRGIHLGRANCALYMLGYIPRQPRRFRSLICGLLGPSVLDEVLGPSAHGV